jgi:hypothetical protein
LKNSRLVGLWVCGCEYEQVRDFEEGA